MKIYKVTNILINTGILITILLVSITISSISLTKKYNQFRAIFINGVTATVVKKEIPILSMTEGIVKKVHVQTGDQVKQGDVLVEIDNPALRDKIETLSQFKDNLSAQTEAKVAESSLRYFTITASVDGVVSEVHVNEGVTVEDTTEVVTLFSNSDVVLLANLAPDKYAAAQRMNHILGFSPRTNQNFLLVPSQVKPEVKVTQDQKKQIGLYLAFINPTDGIGLLQNEDIIIRLRPLDTISRPIDGIVTFWNRILGTVNE